MRRIEATTQLSGISEGTRISGPSSALSLKLASLFSVLQLWSRPNSNSFALLCLPAIFSSWRCSYLTHFQTRMPEYLRVIILSKELEGNQLRNIVLHTMCHRRHMQMPTTTTTGAPPSEPIQHGGPRLTSLSVHSMLFTAMAQRSPSSDSHDSCLIKLSYVAHILDG
ncbi:hypothetical protein BDP27DRAFT_1030494 [Rhodocollybia butyracea]|uniref:Uncharacterized protein n=1 Tax=Rhodocollybia butyracea TaxID=206335 RepID=A0A9P5Q601_9AGAR|nr:hypothetical protein BDP27DRAFT_1030494 [Rhodocollybia butyracea]